MYIYIYIHIYIYICAHVYVCVCVYQAWGRNACQREVADVNWDALLSLFFSGPDFCVVMTMRTLNPNNILNQTKQQNKNRQQQTNILAQGVGERVPACTLCAGVLGYCGVAWSGRHPSSPWLLAAGIRNAPNLPTKILPTKIRWQTFRENPHGHENSTP